jgi:hypothetical protein
MLEWWSNGVLGKRKERCGDGKERLGDSRALGSNWLLTPDIFS